MVRNAYYIEVVNRGSFDMSYQVSTFAGDDVHTMCCTGDVVSGDEVAFERATFAGSLRKPKFVGFELVIGTVVAESYGRDKQQHTFTIELASGGKALIKGRNLYANGVWRKLWQDEATCTRRTRTKRR
jgi:hypothetical protein